MRKAKRGIMARDGPHGPHAVHVSLNKRSILTEHKTKTYILLYHLYHFIVKESHMDKKRGVWCLMYRDFLFAWTWYKWYIVTRRTAQSLQGGDC